MNMLTSLESAVLAAIADQLRGKVREIFLDQLSRLTVSRRENTGAGFFTYFSLNNTSDDELPNLLDLHVEAEINGVKDGLGFILWIKDGHMDNLEGYTLALDSTEGLDLANLNFKLTNFQD